MNGHISSTPSLAPLLNSYQAITYCLRTHYPSLLRPLSNDGEKDSTHYVILISHLGNSVTESSSTPEKCSNCNTIANYPFCSTSA